MNVTTRRIDGRFAAGLLAVGMMAWGCAGPNPTPAPVAADTQVYVPPPPPEPTLQASGDAHLTLFGEMPERTRVPFHARSASPMEQHSFTSEGADFDVDVSPDGKWLVLASTRHTTRPDLYLKTVNGRAVTQLTSDPAADVQPCFSPDGKSVIFASDRAGNWDLWLVQLDGGQTRQITDSPLHEIHPSFAADGKRLVYCLFNPKSDQWELWTLTLDLPGSRRMIGVGLFPRWSPNADSIVYQRARERGGRWFSIWRLDLEQGEPKFPVELAASTEMALIQPTWSDDGDWIAYGTARLGSEAAENPAGPILSRGDVWMVRSDGSAQVQLTDGEGAHFGPACCRDGRVYFTSLQNGSENIWSVKPVLTAVADSPTAAAAQPDAAPAAWEAGPPATQPANQGS